MEPLSPQNTSDSQAKPRGTLYFIQTISLAAIFLATLFTAWTDFDLPPLPQMYSSIVQGNQSQGIAAVNIFTPTPRSRPLIGIVAGHSGFDSGATCPDGLTEASINEKIAIATTQQLNSLGYDVDILQEFDSRLDGYRADALVSIHADSCNYINEQATGFKVSSALASPRKDLAARLTGCLRARYGNITGLTLHNSITPDMTSYHAFEEIDPGTTAAIIEVGFLNLDRQILTQQPELIAQGISEGIACFINKEDPNSSP